MKGSYQPVGKVDIAAIRAQAKDDKFNPKPGPLQSSYKPVGKVDIAAIRAQASKKPSSISSEPAPAPVSTPSKASDEKEDEEEYKPQSVHDRMKRFGGNNASTLNANDDDDEAPKSLKDRMKSYQSKAERITELPKPKTHNSVASRFSAGAASSGTVPPLPSSSFGGPSKPVGGASRDFGSQGGKTPAQIWAEKHAKSTGSSAPTFNSTPAPVQDEEPAETPSISSLRSKFASTAVSEPEHEEEDEEPVVQEDPVEEPAPDVSDLKSKFAQRFAASVPPAVSDSEEPASEPEAPPSLPTRSLPPPLPTAERSLPPPLPAVDRPAPPISEPVPEQSAPPALPGRSLSPAFVPPVVSEPVPEPQQVEEPAAALPPTLPTREPEPESEPVAAPEPASTNGDSVPIDAVVLFNYPKDDDNELGLEEEEIITVNEFTDKEWWMGTNSKGEQGLFPAEYVQLIKGPYAVALYSYEASESNELSFPGGAIITEIEFEDEEWWSGVYYNQRNLFPSNYVELKK